MSAEQEPLDFSKLPDAADTFAAHMKAREDAYAVIFGESDPPGQVLAPTDAQLMLNWPGGGIYVFAPRGDRRGFHYVTHGLSQPLDDAERAVSGLGCELVISTPHRCDWPSMLLLEMAKYLLFEDDAPAVLPGDRMPTGAFRKVAPTTELSYMFATTSTEYPSLFLLPGGRCTLVHLVGATAPEIERAKKEGGAFGTMVLSETLRRLGVGYVTDTARASATADLARFEAAWREVAARVEPN
jgi:hypothetical protein